MKASPEEAIDRVEARASRKCWSVGPPFDARVRRLVRDWGTQKSSALIEEMIATALKIARDEMTVADLKLINRSAKEMRSAAKIFAPFVRNGSTGPIPPRIIDAFNSESIQLKPAM